MSYFIIIRGPLGVGKTAVSKRLAKLLEAEYISIDKVLAENGLDQCGEGGITTENFIKGDDLVLPDAKKYLENGKIVIFDGCFYRMEQIEHLINSLPTERFVFNLKAKVETCIDRDKGRIKVYGEDAARAVHNMVSSFDYGINIDTDGKTLSETVDEVMSYLSR